MQVIKAPYSVSISELKQNPSALISAAGNNPVVILNHNKPTAYLVPADAFEVMIEYIDDLELGRLIEERKAQKLKAIDVSIDDL